MPNNNNPTITLPESGEFNFYTNAQNANLSQNYRVAYERLQSSSPNTPEYQLTISAAVGAGAEFLARISTSVTYEAGLQTLFNAAKVAVAVGTEGLGVGAVSGMEFYTRNQADPVFYKYIDGVGDDASRLFADSTIRVFGSLAGNPENPQIPNIPNPKNEITIVSGVNSGGQSTSITATKTTTPSGEPKVSISSTNYNKEQLTESSQSLFQNEGKNLLGANIKFEGNDGTLNASLLNQSTLDAASDFLAKNTSLETPILTILEKNSANSTSLFLVKNDSNLTLSDGSTSTLATIASTLASSFTTLTTFITTQIEEAFSPIYDALFGNDSGNSNSNNNEAGTPAQRLAGKILADLIAGKDITDIAKDQLDQVLVTKALEDVVAKLDQKLPTGMFKGDTAKFVKGTVENAIIMFAISIAADHRMDSDEYGTAAAKALTSAALIKHFGDGAEGMAYVAAAISIYDSFKADHSMNSEQYKEAAIAAASAAASAYIAHETGAALAEAFAGAGPAGIVAGYAIGYVLGYLLYTPLKNDLTSGVSGLRDVYDGMEDLLLKGEFVDQKTLKENIKEILRGVDDIAISASGRFVKDFAIGAYNLLGGRYGKELKDGQYWQPYATTSISNKLDADLLFLFSKVKKVDFRGKNIFCGLYFKNRNWLFANDNQGFREIDDKKSILM